MNSKDKKLLKEKFRKRLYIYILRLVKFLSKLPKIPIIREIISQLMRSGTSMGANYFEAEGASSKRDYQNFFSHSLKSANETKFWLTVLKNSGLVSKELISECDWLLQEKRIG